MDGSGDFVITWTEQIAQEMAPKDITDIYFRRYAPVGVTDSFSGTAVPGAVVSDLVTPGEATTDPAEYLAQSFTGVRLLTNPTQVVAFTSTTSAASSGHIRVASGIGHDGAAHFQQLQPAGHGSRHPNRGAECRFQRGDCLRGRRQHRDESDLVSTLRARLSAASANDIAVLVGIGAIFPFVRASSVIKGVDEAVTGRLLVLFPGVHDPETHSFRLLDARDGFNYRARVIDPQKDLT